MRVCVLYLWGINLIKMQRDVLFKRFPRCISGTMCMQPNRTRCGMCKKMKSRSFMTNPFTMFTVKVLKLAKQYLEYLT